MFSTKLCPQGNKKKSDRVFSISFSSLLEILGHWTRSHDVAALIFPLYSRLFRAPRPRQDNSHHSSYRQRPPHKRIKRLSPSIPLPILPIFLPTHPSQDIRNEDSCFAGGETPRHEVGGEVLGAAGRELGGRPGYGGEGGGGDADGAVELPFLDPGAD
jgi:hypothetical protein